MLAGSQAAFSGPRVLRVCADPNNLPFSNQRAEGFENHVAEIVAASLGSKLEYTWWAQRKSFVKNTLLAGRCDVIMGIPTGLKDILTTQPYYQSSYEFVTLANRELDIHSFDDPALKDLRIGVHIVGNDYAPPAYALARRGIVDHIVGYSLFGSYGEENPPARILDALARGEIDIAIVWGPVAGYFARKQPVAMNLAAVPQDPALSSIPFAYPISLGVRPSDEALRAELEHAIELHKAEISKLLGDYGVPQPN